MNCEKEGIKYLKWGENIEPLAEKPNSILPCGWFVEKLDTVYEIRPCKPREGFTTIQVKAYDGIMVIYAVKEAYAFQIVADTYLLQFQRELETILEDIQVGQKFSVYVSAKTADLATLTQEVWWCLEEAFSAMLE